MYDIVPAHDCSIVGATCDNSWIKLQQFVDLLRVPHQLEYDLTALQIVLSTGVRV